MPQDEPDGAKLAHKPREIELLTQEQTSAISQLEMVADALSDRLKVVMPDRDQKDGGDTVAENRPQSMSQVGRTMQGHIDRINKVRYILERLNAEVQL